MCEVARRPEGSEGSIREIAAAARPMRAQHDLVHVRGRVTQRDQGERGYGPAATAERGGGEREVLTRDGARLLGDARLLNVHDIHDDAALEHLGEANLGAGRVARQPGTAWKGKAMR